MFQEVERIALGWTVESTLGISINEAHYRNALQCFLTAFQKFAPFSKAVFMTLTASSNGVPCQVVNPAIIQSCNQSF